MFNIIESYRPYFNSSCKDEQTKKLHHLLETLMISKSGLTTITVFQLINVLFDIKEDVYSLYESVGPHIEYNFGDKKCCSYRWGVEPSLDGKYIPNRCISQKLPGYLYCSKHNEKETKICQGCIKDTKKEIIHQYGWEHWGNIFEKNLRNVFIKNLSQFKVSELVSYPLMYLKNKKTILKIMKDKPIVESTYIKRIETDSNKINVDIVKQNVKKKTEILSGLLSKITLSNDVINRMKIYLLFYMLENNLIKMSRIYPIRQINLYDSDEIYYNDNKFIYKRIESKIKGVGIVKNNDTILLNTSIQKMISNDLEYSDIEINSFIDILISKNNE